MKILLNKKGVAMQEKQDMISSFGNKILNDKKNNNTLSSISKKISKEETNDIKSWQYKVKNLFNLVILVKRNELICSKEILLDALFNSDINSRFKTLTIL